MTKPDSGIVALVGADDVQAREVADRLRHMGLPASSILTFGARAGEMELAVDEEGADILLPLEKGALAMAGVWVVFTRDGDTRRKLTGWAKECGSRVLDLAPDPTGALQCRDPRQTMETPLGPGDCLVLPEPSAHFLSLLLAALRPDHVHRVDCHLFQPASVQGEAGIRELFQQAASLLNFKPLPREVWGRQIAFDLLPRPDALASELFGAQVRHLSGLDVDVTALHFQTSVFHGASISALILVHDGKAAEMDMRRGMEAEGCFKMWAENSWPTPLETAGTEEPMVALKGLSDNLLWVWVVYDNVKAGAGALAVPVIKRLLEV